jgi:hypothetical protein
MLCKSPVDLVQLSHDCRQNLSRGLDDPAEICREDSRDRFWSELHSTTFEHMIALCSG